MCTLAVPIVGVSSRDGQPDKSSQFSLSFLHPGGFGASNSFARDMGVRGEAAEGTAGHGSNRGTTGQEGGNRARARGMRHHKAENADVAGKKAATRKTAR